MGGRLEWVCDWFLGDFIFIGVRKYLIFLCKAATTLSAKYSLQDIWFIKSLHIQ